MPGVDGAQTCYSIASTGSFPTVQCSSGTSNRFSYVQMPATVSATTSGSTTAVTLTAVYLYAPLFQLNMQATDLPMGQSGVSAGTDAPTMSATASGVGLSTAAMAGIGVGAAIAGLALIGGFVAFALWRRRRPSVMPELPPENAQKTSSLRNHEELAANHTVIHEAPPKWLQQERSELP